MYVLWTDFAAGVVHVLACYHSRDAAIAAYPVFEGYYGTVRVSVVDSPVRLFDLEGEEATRVRRGKILFSSLGKSGREHPYTDPPRVRFNRRKPCS